MDSLQDELMSLNEFVPSKRARSKNRLPYVDQELRRQMRQRDKLHSRKDPKYKKLKHLVQKKLRAAHWKYVEEVITPSSDSVEAMGQANKRFWSLFKCSKADSTGVPSLKSQGRLVSDAKGKASLLNTTFSAFTSGNASPVLPRDTCSPYPSMSDICITPVGIEKLLNNQNPHKAARPDKIQPMVLKQLAQTIAPILDGPVRRSCWS